MDVTRAKAAEGHIRTIFNGGDGAHGAAASPAVKRVAAYCRVSTAQESQSTSLETQVQAFRQKITEREGWELVDVYADEGLSGTSVKRRAGFQRMLADCEAGKIDYIITKSISRFARNTLECLTYIRYLQSIGVQLLFEKENIDTGSNLSEMILTVLAAFAQEESRSISANVTWGIRKKFEAGVDRWVRRYGYRKGPDGSMEIEPDEARVVYRMFDMYARGISVNAIVAQLNAEGLASPRGGAWSPCSINEMLVSEVYVGDMILQKFCVVDHLTHRRVRNNATEVPSYYITDHHPAIISRELFRRAQQVRMLRRTSKGSATQYPYGCTEMRCPVCGAPLVQRNTRGHCSTRIVLGCFSGEGCGQFAVRRRVLNAAMLDAYNNMDMELVRDQADCEQYRQAALRFLDMKAERPCMDTVEYYWLDELVSSIGFSMRTGGDNAAGARAVRANTAGCLDVEVNWRCGIGRTETMMLGDVRNSPEAVAAMFWQNDQKRRAQQTAQAGADAPAAEGASQ